MRSNRPKSACIKPRTEHPFIMRWVEAMNALLQYVNTMTHIWTGHHIIPNGVWVKQIKVIDKVQIVYVVLDCDGMELASIPVNFSIAIPPQTKFTPRIVP